MHMYEHLQVKLLGGNPAGACDWGYIGLKKLRYGTFQAVGASV